ncbi:endonuclease [Marinicella sp. S1101]|uniref:endonuclease n=1 Tax=Marinicella marina TaxID=2996016 RepID=UPI00226096C5|nr:endonuclease [Marinicella marina]MCX7555078.1 endonuclease [Marinicella marina]MDJ1141386.1 endonuclease [Marinicella marina]
MKYVFCLIMALSIHQANAGGTSELANVLISEVAVTPTAGEFIEIHNAGQVAVSLTDVYLTDATFAPNDQFYYKIVEGGGGGGGFADFFARFPDGATIAGGEYQTIALNGSTNFNSTYGVQPTYELYEDDASADAIPDMLEATFESINNQGGLSGGEVAVLFYWDGVSDLVQDMDYVVWGDKNEAVDKSAQAIDGPDVDANVSIYENETSVADQAVISTNSHNGGQSWQRIDLTEGAEAQTGGNGITGHDETSENLDFTFGEDVPTPNAATNITPPVAQFVINEIDSLSQGNDFIELLGNANTNTDGYTLVLYDGMTDEVSAVISLDGLNTDANGYLLVNQELDSGADAVALYISDAMNFMVGDPITATDLMDAIVYDTGQADDAELLTLLNPGQPQVNENANGNASTESLIRCTNGSGGQLNTNSFKAFTPSPGAENADCVTFDDYYATADNTNAQTLRDSLHNIIDDHVVFPYSSGAEDTWDILSIADEDPQVPGQVWMIYRNNNYTWQGGGQQAYNREHTWPQSYGFSSGALGDDNAARTDTHHLMLSDVGYNSDRGNLYFDDCISGCTSRTTDAHENPNTPQMDTIGGGANDVNLFDGNSFEVWDFRKGDIARAMFYMDVRYAGDVSGEVDLQLTDNASLIQTGAPFMGLLSVLLEWHQADPVDDVERNRNDFIFTKQLNRNPFIDHPEWVECIFVVGGQCATGDNDLIFADGFE